MATLKPDQKKVTTRVAEAQSAQQAQTHQQALVTNLQNDVKKANLSGTPSSSLLKTQGADILRQNASTGITPEQQSILDQNANAGKFQTFTPDVQGSYNTKTKVFSNPSVAGQSVATDLGNIDQGALDRLMASGMSEGEARRQITGNRPDVQQSFNQAGTGLRPKQSAADAAEAQLTTKNPYATPQEIADARAAAAAEEASNAQRDAATAAAASSKPPVTEAAPTATGAAGATPPATPTTPEASGANAAFSNLPPEAQFLAGPLAQMQETLNNAITGSQDLTRSTLAGIQETYGGIQTKLADMEAGYRASTDAMQGLLDAAKEETETMLAEQQKSEQERLSWAQLDARRAAVKQKADAHDAMVAQIALAGGFGQDAGMAAVMESDAQFDGKIADIAIEYGYARNDLAAKYSALYIENKNKYIDATIGNMKELRGALERIGMQGISNATAKQAAEQKALETGWTNQTNLRTTLAKQNLDLAWQIQGVVKEAKQEKIDKEDRALKQISSLLSQFPESEVRDIVLGLGKDVTSFSVEKMLNAKSNDEIEAARKAAAARQEASRLALMQAQKNAPLVTKDEFLKKKIAEKEQASGMSMSPKLREEYIKANQGLFDAEYSQFSSPNFQNLTSGDPKVDAAADAYMRGDLTIKDAAKAFGVSTSDVAIYTGILRTEGAKIGDIRALEPEQRKELSTLRSKVTNSEVTKKLDLMKMAVPKIDIAADAASGIGDVALLNFYQNGIVDPGLAVRKEDQELLSAASALADKANLAFAKDKFLYSKTFTEESRAEMVRIANAVYEATNRIYDEQVVQPVIEQGALSGIDEPYFNYLKRNTTNEAGNNADTYVNTFLPE